MFSEALFLIAHKVRGEPAFDVACRMPCPLCQTYESVTGEICTSERAQATCAECDSVGYWYIIPTSGHRAYPYSTMGLFNGIESDVWYENLGDMPPGLPDHYTVSAAPRAPRPAFLTSLLAKPRVSIPRRGL